MIGMGKLKRNVRGTDIVQPPALFSESELRDFHSLVLEQGQVTRLGLQARIRGAKLLGFHYLGPRLVAVAGLKTPNESYKNQVFREAGVEHLSGQFHTELGWAVTRKEFQGRGIAARLIRKLLRQMKSKNVFATTASDNFHMQRLLARFGFTKTGHPYGDQGPAGRSKLLWLLES
jgi:ribosomal protein S18 acetylase RimI-like enzyme